LTWLFPARPGLLALSHHDVTASAVRRVVVIGVAGSGKSTVTLATELGQIDGPEFATRVATTSGIADGNYSAEPSAAASPASSSGTATANAVSETNSAETPPSRSCSGPGAPNRPTKREYAAAMNDPQYAQLTFVRLKSRRQTRKFLQSVR
jgi:hypothetical protein